MHGVIFCNPTGDGAARSSFYGLVVLCRPANTGRSELEYRSRMNRKFEHCRNHTKSVCLLMRAEDIESRHPEQRIGSSGRSNTIPACYNLCSLTLDWISNR